MGVSCSPAMIQYGPAGEDRSTVQIIFAWYGSALSNCYPQVIVITCIGFVSLFVVGKDFLAVKANVALDGHTMALFPVAFLLVFRNGMSFNRYFEGRGHCGSFVSDGLFCVFLRSPLAGWL